ncbi:GerAB/ArcD/ProY family transporter [Halalkalibacter krulwichiae]|uniref:Spore germination protein YndE n=1 Tax=Halalkalibacter krulwichiae TaxID=199441 RepID=A0A1X9M9W8_9BACI|nr:GerAB/ArcD/ProY family transporter [Halalkalibacter krulwichiae]ARK30259.1 Spore germination protein YndE [Halalkalibacter krulwichiae]
MDKPIKEQYLVSSFMASFLIHGMQVGVGVLGFQRIIVKTTGYDAWISVIIAGIIVHFIIACMYVMLKKADGDIVTIQRQIFGKWIGNLLSIIICFYFIALATAVLRTYIEVIQVWIFPDLQTWTVALVAAVFFYYVVAGGFRTVVGLTFIGVIIPFLLMPILLMPLEFAHFINMLPILKHSIVELLLGAKDTTLTFLGFELLLLYYPFLKKRELSQKWAQFGAFVTNLSYTTIMIVSLAFYSEQQLDKTIWATLTLFKVIQLPFLERFEYIGISMWMFLIAPNIALALWGASRCAKRAFSINQRKALVIALAMMTVITMLLPTRQEVDMMSNIVSQFGFYFVFVYIPLLVILQAIVLKVRRKKSEETTAM